MSLLNISKIVSKVVCYDDYQEVLSVTITYWYLLPVNFFLSGKLSQGNDVSSKQPYTSYRIFLTEEIPMIKLFISTILGD